MLHDQLKKLMMICEARNPDFTYDESNAGKVIVQLQSYKSQSYTKLAQKIEKVKALEAEVKQLKLDIVQEGRENVNDLFDASDAVNTRVVETVSFIYQLTKDPKATEAPKYKDILEALTLHLTPELIVVLTQLKAKMVTVTQKQPALSLTDKNAVGESIGDMGRGIASAFRAFKAHVQRWAYNYDEYLTKLKLEARYLDN